MLSPFDRSTGKLTFLNEVASRGADLMGRALDTLERGALIFEPQPQAGVTYAAKIESTETRIDWRLPWREVHNHIRGLSPFPGAWLELIGPAQTPDDLAAAAGTNGYEVLTSLGRRFHRSYTPA